MVNQAPRPLAGAGGFFCPIPRGSLKPSQHDHLCPWFPALTVLPKLRPLLPRPGSRQRENPCTVHPTSERTVRPERTFPETRCPNFPWPAGYVLAGQSLAQREVHGVAGERARIKNCRPANNRAKRQQEGDEATYQSELISICLALAGRVLWRGIAILSTPCLNEALMSSLEQSSGRDKTL